MHPHRAGRLPSPTWSCGVHPAPWPPLASPKWGAWDGGWMADGPPKALLPSIPSHIKRQLLRPCCASFSLPSPTPALVVGQPGAPVPRTPIPLTSPNPLSGASRNADPCSSPTITHCSPPHVNGCLCGTMLWQCWLWLPHACPSRIFLPSKKKVTGASKGGLGCAGPGATRQPWLGALQGRRGQCWVFCLSHFQHGKLCWSAGLGTSFPLPRGTLGCGVMLAAWLWASHLGVGA